MALDSETTEEHEEKLDNETKVDEEKKSIETPESEQVEVSKRQHVKDFAIGVLKFLVIFIGAAVLINLLRQHLASREKQSLSERNIYLKSKISSFEKLGLFL